MEPQARNNKAFLQRLDDCVERVGGKRAMATATLISEAQLFRYLGGDSILPTDRLLSIAEAAKVDAGWLLTGDGNADSANGRDLRPTFRPELLVQITQVFEELLLEYEKPFTPRQRARAIAFMYDALRHDEHADRIELSPHKSDMLEILNFLSEIKTEDELSILQRFINLREYEPGVDVGGPENLQLVTAFCNLIARGYANYFNSYTGQVYFDRMGLNLDNPAIQRLNMVIEDGLKATKRKELDFLDIGCGNGRHISYLHRHMPHIHVNGIDISERGVQLCHTLSVAGKLPPQAVSLGDYRSLPYKSESFDLVYSRMSLWNTPYVPGSACGMEEAFAEVRRVLRPGGQFVMTSLYGNGMRYLTFRQFLDEHDIARLAKDFGFKVHSFEKLIKSTDNGGDSKKGDYHTLFDNSFRAVLTAE